MSSKRNAVSVGKDISVSTVFNYKLELYCQPQNQLKTGLAGGYAHPIFSAKLQAKGGEKVEHLYQVVALCPEEKIISDSLLLKEAVKLAKELAFNNKPKSASVWVDPLGWKATSAPVIRVGWWCEQVDFQHSSDVYDENDRCYPYEVRLIS